MTRKDFIEAVESLRTDYNKNPEIWENKTVNDFLEAIARYTDDIQGYYDNTGQDVDANKPDWKIFIDILKGASIYE